MVESSSLWRLEFRCSRSSTCVYEQDTMVARSWLYLLLQSHYAGPLLFQQPLVLLSCGIVEAGGDAYFFAKRSSSFRGVYHA